MKLHKDYTLGFELTLNRTQARAVKHYLDKHNYLDVPKLLEIIDGAKINFIHFALALNVPSKDLNVPVEESSLSPT